jgi:hypothetical protein
MIRSIPKPSSQGTITGNIGSLNMLIVIRSNTKDPSKNTPHPSIGWTVVGMMIKGKI